MGQINTTNYPTVASLADDDLLIVENAQNGTGTTTPKQLRENAIGTGTLDTQAQTVIGAINEVNAHDVPIATTSVAGKVKPDGSTITVNSSGTISSVDQTPIATTSTAGKVKPDGTTITINSSGVITSVGSGVSDVAWDTTNKKLTKTVDGTTSDIVTGATILNGLTSSQVTTALGYTPPAQDTDTHRPIQVNGSQVLGNNTTALNLKAGTNVTLTSSGGNVTISASGGSGGASMSKQRYTVSYSSWSSSQSGGYYTYNLALSTSLNVNYPPNVYIAGSGDTTEPTITGAAMFSLLSKCNLSASNNLVLYAKVKPTWTFYIYVEGLII